MNQSDTFNSGESHFVKKIWSKKNRKEKKAKYSLLALQQLNSASQNVVNNCFSFVVSFFSLNIFSVNTILPKILTLNSTSSLTSINKSN